MTGRTTDTRRELLSSGMANLRYLVLRTQMKNSSSNNKRYFTTKVRGGVSKR